MTASQTIPKPETWQRKHAKVCRYKADERWGLDLDGCCRCRYLDAVRGPRPGAAPPRRAGRWLTFCGETHVPGPCADGVTRPPLSDDPAPSQEELHRG